MDKKLARQLWTDLAQQLGALERPATALGLVRVVLAWTGEHVARFGPLVARYGLDELVRCDPATQPVEYSDMNAEEEIERFGAVPPASLETLAMRIRDLLWGALVYRTHRQCPRCDGDQLRALHGATASVVLACDACGFACDADGNEWTGGEKLSPMNMTDLKAHRLFLRPVKSGSTD
jgi:hypothetical protein